jgi:FAD/FMN-containing dehydrogenase
MGFVSATGVTGLTLGGGFGYMTKRYGWTADNVAGMEMVTADGKLVRASSTENEDLFWGLRGGGGNFGIVTGIDFNLYPVGPEIIGGLVAWHASEAPEVMELFRTISGQASPELTLVLIIRPAPPAPWLPVEIHGKPIVAILACYTGSHGREEKIINTIKSFKNTVGDVLIPRSYTQMQSLLDSSQPKGRRYYWKSEYLPQIDAALGEKVIMHAARIASPHSAVILFQIEGALNRMEPDFSAAGNRNAHFVLNIAGSWDKAEDDEKNIGWARDAWNDMKSFSAGGNYINFQTHDEGADRIEAAYGKGLQRLAKIKAIWDPENIFRTNRNIQPA